MDKGRAFIGTSGYIYGHWRNGVFYPPGLPQSRWLDYYCRFFNTVEINFTFYSLPKENVVIGWHRRTPADFVFVTKGSRFITHIKRLKDCREPLRRYFEPVSLLKKKLSLVLWQTPPFFKKDLDRLSSFLEELRRYEQYRHCFEFRNETWFTDEVFDLLRERNIAVCSPDPAKYAKRIPITADFVYLRRHGQKYTGNYSASFLANDAKMIRRWNKQGRDVYDYFNNDIGGHAVRNAYDLRKRLEGRELLEPWPRSGKRPHSIPRVPSGMQSIVARTQRINQSGGGSEI